MVVKTIQTNKATIDIMGDNTVKKTFNCKKQARKEFDSLLWLFRLFNKTKVNGWTYKVVEPIRIHDNIMIMKKAKGFTFETKINDSASSKSSGVWLALFHQKIANSRKVKRIDYNRKNILIDKNTKTLTVIDPGATLLKDCTTEFSVLDTVVGLIIGSLERRLNPKPIIKSFLNGYFSISSIKFDLPGLKKGLDEVVKARYRIQRRKKRNRAISYIQLHVIKIYTSLIILQMLKE